MTGDGSLEQSLTSNGWGNSSGSFQIGHSVSGVSVVSDSATFFLTVAPEVAARELGEQPQADADVDTGGTSDTPVRFCMHSSKGGLTVSTNAPLLKRENLVAWRVGVSAATFRVPNSPASLNVPQ